MPTHQLRPGLPEMPESMKSLPIEKRGYPVPYFVAWVNGEPDFRVSDGRKLAECVQFKRCWLCGKPLGAHLAFNVGPMCAISRTSSEPPSHRNCAEFAAKACPFLSMPKAQRRDSNLPSEAVDPTGIPIKRNPGVSLVWVTRSFERFGDGRGGVLFEMGPPVAALWFSEGRDATRAEILASIDSGYPALEAMARSDKAGAIAHLESERARVVAMLPASP